MPDDRAPAPLGVFGLGIIGSRVADHLGASGHPLGTWSRSPRSRPDFVESAEQLASRSQVLLLYLKDAPAVRSVLEEIRPHLSPGKTLINHATVDLDTTAWLKALCRDCGCGFLNAPFTGSRNAAAQAQLVYYAGGDAETLDAVRPILELTSRSIIPLPSAAQATVIKLVTNLVTACSVQALSESLQISLAHGVSPDTLQEAFAENACGSVLAGMKLPTMAAGDYEPHFSLSNMLKDSRYALDLAERAGLETPALQSVSERMDELDRAGHGEADFSILNTLSSREH